MEKRNLTIKKQDRDLYVKINEVFYWKLDEEITLKNEKILLKFSRDENIENLNKIKVVEMDYQPHIFSLIFVIIPAILAFILMTVALVIFFVDKSILKPLTLTTCFLLPDLALLGVAVFMSYLRNQQMSKYHINQDEFIASARKKISEITK